MNNILLFIIEWSGTCTVIFGILLLASKKASNPKIRIKGLIISGIGCSILAGFGFIIGAFGIMVTQIGVIIVDIYGIRNCYLEISE